jgi:hypothetical protein
MSNSNDGRLLDFYSVDMKYVVCSDVSEERWNRTSILLTSPHSTHYRHIRHMLPHNHDGVITLFKYFNNF